MCCVCACMHACVCVHVMHFLDGEESWVLATASTTSTVVVVLQL